MTDVRPDWPATRWAGWTVEAFDAAIEARWEKYHAAMLRGDLAAAIAHEEWVDRLLDGRLCVKARGLS